MGTVNEETADVNLTATTAAATPCPEICEQTQNTGECSAGDQIFVEYFPIICKQDTKTLPEAQRTQKFTPRLGLNLATTWRLFYG